MKKIAWGLLITLMGVAGPASARTRQAVIADAAAYSAYNWTPSGNNLLDVMNHFAVLGTTFAAQPGVDGYDDRAFKRNIKTQKWEYSIANWPFAVGAPVTGEAYAWAGYYVVNTEKIPWGADTTSTFTLRLADSPNKWIAGARANDVAAPGVSTIMTPGYKGFTGIDCSGFVGNALDINRFAKPDFKFGVSGIKARALPIKLADLRLGDVFASRGHIIMFKSWAVKYSRANVVHAVPYKYTDNEHVRRVVEEIISVTIDVDGNISLDNAQYINPVPHEAKSLFPQFAWTTPVKVNPAIDQLPMYDPLGPAIKLTIKTGNNVKVKKSSVRLVLDEGAATEVKIANSVPELRFSPDSDNQDIIVTYAIPANIMLPPGNHRIKVYATNTLDLEDSDELYFTVPVPSAPGIRWTDYFNNNGVSGDIRGFIPGVGNAPWLHTGAGALQLTGMAALKDFRIYNDDTMGSVVYGKDFIAGANTAVIGNALDTVPDKLGYYAVLRDQLDNTSVMHFHLDKNGPVIDPAAKSMINAAGDGFTFTVSGIQTDAVSGVGSSVEMRDGIGGVVSSSYTGPGYPAGPPSAPFSFADIVSDKKFVFFDRAGWIGTYDLLVDNQTSGLNVSNINYPAEAIARVYGHSGVILRSAALSVSGVMPQPGPHIHLVDQPQGMQVELRADSVNEASTANLPVTYGYAPAGSQTLLTSTGSGSYTGTFDLPLYRLGGIKLVTTPNTNPVRYQEDIDTNGDGIYDATQPGTFPAGFFHLSADATGSAAYTNLYGLAHFNKDIELGPVRTAQSGNVAVGITSVTAGGNVTIESARYTLVQPGYKMANNNTIYEIKTTAVFSGPVYLKIGFCEAGYSAIQRSTPTIFHCDAGMACTPVDTRLDGQCTAAATVYSLSPFGVMVPIDDITPPHTGVEFIGTNNLVGVGLWVTTETYINLNSNDNTNIGDISGVATTYYLLDTAPTPDCLAAPYDPGAPYGACANSRYTGAFTLTEGSHTITYLSADNWGNREQPASKSLFVDGTSPVTTFTANGVEAQAGKTVNIIWTDSVTLTAVDPVSGGVASGFNRTQYLIDTDPASCGGAEMDPAAPGGSCQYEPYNGPFTLSAGLHSLYFRSIDNVENIEPFQKIDVNCAGDLTPPTVTLSLNGVDVSTFATVNALATDSITITAVDPAVDVFISGVKAAYYLIDVTTATCQTPPDLIGPVGTCRNPVYAGVFTLEAGSHTIYYTAEDNAGNVAEGKSVSINVHSFGFKGSAQAWDSVLWAWNLKAGATAYQVVSTTGGAISPILAADASSYLQLGLSPNTRYSNFIRSYGDTVSESAPFEAVTLANIPISIESFTSGQSASVVIGQSGFYSNSPSAGTTGLSLPEGVTLDAGGNLWVADRYNHRVLRFSPPFTTGMSANLSIGQTNLYLNLAPAFRAPDSLSQPESLAFDKNGNLWVADGYSGYSRVLRFSPPFFTGMSANLVIGAPDFYSYYSLIPSALNFSNLYLHVGVDSTNAVWVSDAGNHRVLRFSPPFTNGMPADLVIGQPDFISYSAGPPATATGLYGPAGIAFDGEDSLWVSDEFNNRVLKFEKPFVNGKAATLAIGQPDLYSPQSYSIVPPAQNTLNRPMALSFDVLGNIYTLEYGNNRVLRFSPPFSNNMNADMVIGQADFTSRLAALTPANFQSPRMGDVKVSGFIITDAHGRMWVADTSNNRVLLFESGKVRAFSRIGVSSFTTQWDGNFNPAQTIYNAEASKSADFSANIIGSGDISALEYTFTGVSGDSKYYVRVKAKNIAGVGSAYGFLGSVVTKPDIPTGFAGIVQSSNSILWNWNTPGGVSNYQIFNSTGLAVSPVLPPGTTYYAQTGLLPNNIYSDFLRVSNESGAAESSPAGQMTFAALPGQPEIFSNGQEADFVIGQPDFTSSLLGPSANRLNFPLGMAKDVNGNLWVLDKCRVLRFAPPFRTNMSADTVLGQSDFGSATCGVGRNKFAYPYPPGMMAFDPENRLWVSDTANNRVLMFNPPFSNGMDADLVLGQSDFNSQGYGAGTNRLNQPKGLSFDPGGRLWLADSGNNRVLRYTPPFINGMSADINIGGYSLMPTQNNLQSPSDVKADASGNIWVADTANRRVLGFQPPFSNGMNASVVIGQSGFTTASGIVAQNNIGRSATSIELDKYGNLYSVDTDANRILVFKPPFSNGMNASAVLGQVNFNYAARSISSSGLLGPYVALAYNGLTLLATDAAPRVLGFNAKLPFVNTSSTSATVRWYNTDNPPNTEYKAEISPDASFPAVLAESPWVASSSYAFSGLMPGSTYYARLRVRNLNNIESGPLYLGYTTTREKEKLFSRSASTIDGNPEIAMNAGIQTTVVQVATGATGTLIYLGAAATQGLSLVSNLYEIGPEGVYEPPATLTFHYSTAALAAAGLAENEAAVYEHISGSGWVKLPNQILDVVNKTITVPVTRIASLFGIFGVVQDKTAPITELSGSQIIMDEAGRSYINLRSSVAFIAYDPVVYGTSTGVAFTEYRIDPDSATLFSVYSSPFMLAEGCHSIEYRSRDNAGNYGISTTSLLCVDGVPAVSSVSIYGSIGKDAWYISPASVILTSTDNLSGTASLYYSIDGSSFALYSSSFAVNGEGVHMLKYYSVDRVGNKEAEKDLAFKLDLNAPLVGAVSGPLANNYGWNNTAVAVIFSGTDTVSGLAYCEPAKVVDTEGSSRTVTGYCTDYAGWSSTATLTINIDTTAPAMDYLLNPPANADGWNNGPVEVVFAGSDTLSGLANCEPTKAISVEGASQTVSGYCTDYAGNSSTASIILNIDRTAPGIIISSPAAEAIYMAGKDKLEIRLAIPDNLDPAPSATVLLTQTEDKGAPRGSRPASIGVANGQVIEPMDIDDGIWRLEVTAKDIAGNSTQAVSGLFEVVHDTIPPQTSLSIGAPNFIVGENTFITSQTPLLFSATDDMLIAGDQSGVGVAATYIYIDSQTVAPVAAGLFVAGESTHTVNYFSIDLASNSEVMHSSVFIIDDSSPVSAITFSTLAIVGADGGSVIPKGSSVSFTSMDMPSGLASGVSNIWYSVDSGTASVFAGSFALAVGSHTIVYWSSDNLGNTEASKTALLSVMAVSGSVIKLNLEPSTLNLNSKGESVTAKLWLEGSGQACFKLKTINISAINGLMLKKPIYALSDEDKDDDDHGNSRKKDNDKGHSDDDSDYDGEHSPQCGSITVKFDRDAVIAVLPTNTVSSITVSGTLSDGSGFSASDTIRTIKPRKITRKDGGRFDHEKRAGFEAPARALKEDSELYVLSVEGDLDARESRKNYAAKTRGVFRRGFAYEFGPEGSVFDKPVTISLPYDADEKTPEKLAIAYWNEALTVWELLPSRRDVSSKLVKADVPHFSQYQVVAASYAVSATEPIKRTRVSDEGNVFTSAADPTFRLGEIYVFPNPAKGADTPTFHIETGIADSVKITIYTVSGRTAHEYTLTGTPAELDDGNGLSYAYEYTWRGHIPTGVYLYYIEAQKAGQKLKKTGKFAVIR